MERKLILRNNLMKLRETEQLTQEQFAERINKSRSWVSLVEAGIRNPTEESLQSIATIFHIEHYQELYRQEFTPPLSTMNKSALFHIIKESVQGVKSGRLVFTLQKEKIKEIHLESVFEHVVQGSEEGIATAISDSLHKLSTIIGLQESRLAFSFTLSNQGDVLSLNAMPDAV